MRKLSWIIFALVGLSSGFALASVQAEQAPSVPVCSQYKTWQTCNADPRCMWYGPYCGPRLE